MSAPLRNGTAVAVLIGVGLALLTHVTPTAAIGWAALAGLVVALTSWRRGGRRW